MENCEYISAQCLGSLKGTQANLSYQRQATEYLHRRVDAVVEPIRFFSERHTTYRTDIEIALEKVAFKIVATTYDATLV